MAEVEIGPATEVDIDDLWRIFRVVIEAGDAYTFDLETTREQALGFWMGSGSSAYVAVVAGSIRGAT